MQVQRIQKVDVLSFMYKNKILLKDLMFCCIYLFIYFSNSAFIYLFILYALCSHVTSPVSLMLCSWVPVVI